jgi:hypothetical protein
MKSMTWAQRFCIGSGLVLASVFTVPTVAGATDPGCYTGCTTPSTVLNNNVPPPTTSPAHTSATLANGSSSLPFTGADVGELAAVGAGAVVIGGLLARRRRSAS